MGEGRHAVPLALAGFETFGVDRSVERLATACRAARERRLTFHAWAADLDTYPLPAERFDLLFCTRFLLRARWDDLKRSVKPGGFVMYETFTIHQVKLGRGPSSPDHLLQPGELVDGVCGLGRPVLGGGRRAGGAGEAGRAQARRLRHRSGPARATVVSETILEVRGVTKSYGGLRPLRMERLALQRR